jgi:hypothetical protein
MTSLPPVLPKYSDCEYSLFISYAHDDNTGHNGWITALKEAIWARLQLLAPEISKLGLHLSEENGPSAGHLSDELKKRVARSFGMLLVVGETYARSAWCEKELELFAEVYGAAGTENRLFIAVMSQNALDAAQAGDQWKKIVKRDQLWVPMFDREKTNEPLAPKLGKQFADEFFRKANKISDVLRAAIEADHARCTKSLLNATATSASNAGPWISASRYQRQVVGIGPCSDNLLDKAGSLKNVLENAGVDVHLLDRRLIDNYRPKTGSPLRDELEKIEVLVAPISEAMPLRPDLPGGHTSLITQEWANARKSRSIIWYMPADLVVPEAEKADPEHLERFKHLAPLCTSEAAVADLLLGAKGGNAIRVYIEKHPKTPAYWRLSDELDAAWDTLPPDPNRPTLKCELLDLDKMDSAPKDVGGVVLLFPEGLKDYEALKAQQKLVEQFFPKKGSAYPGCVALILSPPPSRSLPTHDWPSLQFCKYDREPSLVIDEDSRQWLNEFLRAVWRRHSKETATRP